MDETKAPLRKRLITGWRQVERRKAEVHKHHARRVPYEILLLPPLKP